MTLWRKMWEFGLCFEIFNWKLLMKHKEQFVLFFNGQILHDDWYEQKWSQGLS